MNSRYADYISIADTVLDGAAMPDVQQDPHRWCCVRAMTDCTFELTSDTMFDEVGASLDAELVTLLEGAYFYMYANKITHKTGTATYYRQEASQ